MLTEEQLRFKHKPWIEAAEELLRFDETERALALLDLVPAVHRDFLILELENLKKDIRAACITTHAYMTSELDCGNISPEHSKESFPHVHRFKLVEKDVETLNKQGTIPCIIDMGPGEYILPMALQQNGHKFKYSPIAIDKKAYEQAKPYVKDVLVEQTTANDFHIFVAQEVIEHLPSTQDIAIEAFRWCKGWPNIVHLSTPLYTYNVAPKEWRKPCGLAHLRAYTPNEFMAEAKKLFPGYNWSYSTDVIQSMRGEIASGGAVAPAMGLE